MASVKGTNFTNITADPIVKIDRGEWSGKMRVKYDTYEASSLASGSDISIARLPKGAKVYDIVVHFDALGGSTTISVGDSGAAARYIAATSTASAALNRFNRNFNCFSRNFNCFNRNFNCFNRNFNAPTALTNETATATA